MDEERRSPRTRPGAPRRPAGSRARAGGSARPVDRRAPSPQRQTPTRPLPVQEERAHRPVRVPAREEFPEDRSAAIGQAAAQAEQTRPPAARRRSRHRLPRPVRLSATLLALVLIVIAGWVGGLTLWADSRIEHVDALSDADGTRGTTYLIAGSDGRGGDAVADDGTEGQRADTIMLLHRAPGGRSYLVSLPRDTLVDIPGHGGYKLNAAFAFGGPELLVQTVEQFTGLTIDHYVEIGFDGVQGLVDAVGTVNLCIDRDVDDEKSGLRMTEGCHDVGGDQALAFVRARYFDPTADIGRQQRQQQFVGALMDRALSPGVLLNPIAQMRLAGAGSDALRTSEGTGVIDLGRMALTARSAMGSGSVAIPIEDPEFQTRHSGVAIKTDDAEVKAFFAEIADGSLDPAEHTPEG